MEAGVPRRLAWTSACMVGTRDSKGDVSPRHRARPQGDARGDMSPRHWAKPQSDARGNESPRLWQTASSQQRKCSWSSSPDLGRRVLVPAALVQDDGALVMPAGQRRSAIHYHLGNGAAPVPTPMGYTPALPGRQFHKRIQVHDSLEQPVGGRYQQRYHREMESRKNLAQDFHDASAPVHDRIELRRRHMAQRDREPAVVSSPRCSSPRRLDSYQPQLRRSSTVDGYLTEHDVLSRSRPLRARDDFAIAGMVNWRTPSSESRIAYQRPSARTRAEVGGSANHLADDGSGNVPSISTTYLAHLPETAGRILRARQHAGQGVSGLGAGLETSSSADSRLRMALTSNLVQTV